MQSLSMRISVTALLVLVALVAGCAPKIVRPPDPHGPIVSQYPQAPVQLPSAGGVTEQTLQVIQAELKPVYFDYDSFSLSAEGRTALQHNAEVLRRASRLTVVAEGHCDERGTAEYNLALGERRAATVVDYLVTLGIPQQQLSTVSFGSELPVDPAHNDAAWSKNRRVHMRATR